MYFAKAAEKRLRLREGRVYSAATLVAAGLAFMFTKPIFGDQ
jgi:hypothetical protein